MWIGRSRSSSKRMSRGEPQDGQRPAVGRLGRDDAVPAPLHCRCLCLGGRPEVGAELTRLKQLPAVRGRVLDSGQVEFCGHPSQANRSRLRRPLTVRAGSAPPAGPRAAIDLRQGEVATLVCI